MYQNQRQYFGATSKCDLQPDECNVPPKVDFILRWFFFELLGILIAQKSTYASSPIQVGQKPRSLALVKISQILFLTLDS